MSEETYLRFISTRRATTSSIHSFNSSYDLHLNVSITTRTKLYYHYHSLTSATIAHPLPMHTLQHTPLLYNSNPLHLHRLPSNSVLFPHPPNLKLATPQKIMQSDQTPKTASRIRRTPYPYQPPIFPKPSRLAEFLYAR